MKWHKISDGDYPKRYYNVLVAFLCVDGCYSKYACEMAMRRPATDGVDRWFMDTGSCVISSTDRWAYIDLLTD